MAEHVNVAFPRAWRLAFGGWLLRRARQGADYLRPSRAVRRRLRRGLRLERFVPTSYWRAVSRRSFHISLVLSIAVLFAAGGHHGKERLYVPGSRHIDLLAGVDHVG